VKPSFEREEREEVKIFRTRGQPFGEHSHRDCKIIKSIDKAPRFWAEPTVDPDIRRESMHGEMRDIMNNKSPNVALMEEASRK